MALMKMDEEMMCCQIIVTEKMTRLRQKVAAWRKVARELVSHDVWQKGLDPSV